MRYKDINKAWMYFWPDDKNFRDGKVLFKRLQKQVVKNLKLREFPIDIIVKL